MSVCIQHLKSQLQCPRLASVTTMTPQVWQTGLGAAGSGTEEKEVLSVRHPGGPGQVMKHQKRVTSFCLQRFLLNSLFYP